MLSLTVNDTILLRTYLEDDAAEHFNVVHADRKHLRPFLRWVDAHMKAAQSLDYIRYTHVQQDSQQALMLGIFENGKLIGEVGMHQWEQDLKKAQIGYWITQAAEGKGIVTNAMTRFLQYIFTSLNMNKLEIRFIPSNMRSARLAERLGFKIEGILRESYFLNGRAEDLVVTGLLSKEWKNAAERNIK